MLSFREWRPKTFPLINIDARKAERINLSCNRRLLGVPAEADEDLQSGRVLTFTDSAIGIPGT